MNYVNVEVVIDQTIRRFKLREWVYDIEELVEDISSALRHIGAAKIWEDKIAEVTVNSMVAPLPADCQNVKHLEPLNMPYNESGSFLEIDVPDGTKVKVIYQAMPVDNRGYPLIPDNEAVFAAIMWYLVSVLVLQGEIKTVGYSFADQEWQWRCGSARAVLNAPSLQSVNKMANDFTRLNPIKDAYERNLTDIGKSNRGFNRDKFRN